MSPESYIDGDIELLAQLDGVLEHKEILRA